MNIPLIEATLQTLLKFLNWIPLGYVFETKLISTLIYKVCLRQSAAYVWNDFKNKFNFLLRFLFREGYFFLI